MDHTMHVIYIIKIHDIKIQNKTYTIQHLNTSLQLILSNKTHQPY